MYFCTRDQHIEKGWENETCLHRESIVPDHKWQHIIQRISNQSQLDRFLAHSVYQGFECFGELFGVLDSLPVLIGHWKISA